MKRYLPSREYDRELNFLLENRKDEELIKFMDNYYTIFIDPLIVDKNDDITECNKILPNINNSNNPKEIEQFFIDNPDLLNDVSGAIKQVMTELRPADRKAYAKYFAEALSFIPLISVTTNGNGNAKNQK